MTVNIKVVTTTEGMPQLRNAPRRSAAAVVIEGRPRVRGHIDYATRKMIRTDVWSSRQEAHRRARADRFLTLHPSNSKRYEPNFVFFFSENVPIISGQVLKSS